MLGHPTKLSNAEGFTTRAYNAEGLQRERTRANASRQRDRRELTTRPPGASPPTQIDFPKFLSSATIVLYISKRFLSFFVFCQSRKAMTTKSMKYMI
jgi:YD repeat-containing protein